MIYFSPETSKKLEEMGLEPTVKLNTANYPIGTADVIRKPVYSTLDICELENAKKLWGEKSDYHMMFSGVCLDDECNTDGSVDEGWRYSEYEYHLCKYITLSDEGRLQYVEDYLKTL